MYCFSALFFTLVFSNASPSVANPESPDVDFYYSDSLTDLFPSDDFIDAQPENSMDVGNPQPLDFLADAPDCFREGGEFTDALHTRNDDCAPSPSFEPSFPKPQDPTQEAIRKLLGPLDPNDVTGETAKENYISWFCPDDADNPLNGRAIPICSSGNDFDTYPHALGGFTLQNCALCRSDNPI